MKDVPDEDEPEVCSGESISHDLETEQQYSDGFQGFSERAKDDFQGNQWQYLAIAAALLTTLFFFLRTVYRFIIML